MKKIQMTEEKILVTEYAQWKVKMQKEHNEDLNINAADTAADQQYLSVNSTDASTKRQ